MPKSKSRKGVRRQRHALPKLIKPTALDASRVGRKNLFTCPLGHQVVTVDRDAGITPQAVRCTFSEVKGFPRALVVCDLPSLGGDYPDTIHRDPMFEWYRPAAAEHAALTTWERDWVRRGGLLIRPVTSPYNIPSHLVEPDDSPTFGEC